MALIVEMTHRLASNLRRARTEASAFTDVYSVEAPALLVFFARRTFDIEVARDLTAETFAQAFEHRRRFRGSTDAEAAGWLYGIARHQLSRYVRRGVVERKAVQRLGIQVPPVSADDLQRILDLAELGDMRGRLAAAFSSLPADQGAALRLRVIDERSYADVAARLGVSEQTARARVSRGLRRLAEVTTPTEVTP